MSRIFVCPLSALDRTLSQSAARTMISLSGPGKSPEKPLQIDRGYLALEFNDIAAPRVGLVEPDRTHIGKLLELVRQWDRDDALLIHCWMGISRSTAAAVIALASLEPKRDLSLLAKELRIASPMATPNPLMIAIADDMLGLNNRLVRAIAAIGRGAETSEGKPFSLEAGR